MADVQPFYIYPLDEEEAHLCPVRAMAEWINASQVTSGFLFRRFTAQDRPSAHEDTAMVSYKLLIASHELEFGKILYRLQKSSSNYFETTCLTSASTPFLTELTPSAVVAVSILHRTGVGRFAQSVSGGDGARNLPTSPLCVILSRSMIIQHREGRTFLIPKKSLL